MATHAFPTSVVKSIQTGSIAVPSDEKSATATINSVNTAKSIVLLNGAKFGSSPGSFDKCFAFVQLTNATTVTVTFGKTDTVIRQVAYTVLEFY